MPVGVADNGNHQPPDGDERWQESWYLMWIDPQQRAGGYYHLSQWRNQGICDVWSWTALDGEVVGKFQHLTLPIPDADLSDIAVGGLTIKTREPLRSFDFSATYDDACSTAVAYDAYDRHVEEYVLSPAGASIGDSHYESFGTVTGTVDHRGRSVAVSGLAFADHSWGLREMGKLLTERSVIVSFGEDLYAQLLNWTTPEGRSTFGYVFDEGVSHPLTELRTNMVIDDDGHTPLRADIKARCGDRTYDMRAEGWVSSVTSAQDGFFITDTYCDFYCGDRVGTGLIEAMELHAPAPWHRELLGLDR